MPNVSSSRPRDGAATVLPRLLPVRGNVIAGGNHARVAECR